MVISHNLMAMNAQRQFNINTKNKAKTTERLSSGFRINRAADDAAGLAISEKMRWMIHGLNQGTRNTHDGISFVQIGDGAMGEVHDMINRIEELAVYASNGTLSNDERGYIDEEVQQLKSQINKISTDTVFNELPVFDNSSFINVTGTPKDMSFFDAYYDDATGDFSYGGFIFDGERVTWDKVSTSMIDPDTGLFKGGTYNYTDSNGTTFTLSTKKDGSIPEFTRTLSVTASSSGVNIDGNDISWDKLVDEDGNKCSPSNVHAGAWMLDYKGAEVSLFVSNDVETMDDLVAEIGKITDNTAPVYYVWDEEYIGDEPKKAVDVTTISNFVVSQKLADALIKDPSFSISVSADDAGVKLVDKDGNSISGSEASWSELGISSWNSGTSISDAKVYKYNYTEDGKTVLSFNFTLANETSKDSVIDGLNGMKINSSGIKTNYSTIASLSDSTASMTANIRNTIGFGEEYNLGRPFNTSSGTLSKEKVDYTAASNTATLEFADSTDSYAITFEGKTNTAEKTVADMLDNYWTKVADVKLNSAILGEDYSVKTINDVVGSGNITTDGYFASVVKINDSTMHKTDGSGSYHAGENGKNYAAAYIDFKNLNTAEKLKGLIGTGFDSTCKTCDNHYSVIFKDSISGGSTSSEGYVSKLSSKGNNYTLEVDINSLVNSGVTDGAKLAKALVDITSDKFDFHYTQYASEGTKLYVYDNRTQETPAKAADFWTVPFDPDTIANFNVNMKDKSGDGDYVNLSYKYDITELTDRVTAVESKDPDGKYVKNSDITPGAKGYSEYNASDPLHATLERYNIEVGYYNPDGTLAASKSESINNNASSVVKKLLNETSVELKFTDFTRINTSGNENSNVAMAPMFINNIHREGENDYIYIYHSGVAGDRTGIPRYAMNTAAMSLSGASTKTVAAAEKTIGYTKRANSYVSSCRASYGAIQNRLEHTVRNNENKEENMTAAESRIRDTEMASTMVKLSIQNILEQAGVSVLSQANQSAQNVLSLLS